MSTEPPKMFADDRIGFTARRDYQPATPALQDALKNHEAAVRDRVQDVISRKKGAAR